MRTPRTVRGIAGIGTAAITALGFAGPSLAQTTARELRARDFLPVDHTTAMAIDVAAIVDSALYDAIERSPARMLLESFRKQYGFDIAELRRVTLGQVVTPPEDEAQPWTRRHVQAWLLEGSAKVRLDPTAEGLRDAESRKAGAVTVFDVSSRTEAVDLGGGVVVFGTEGVVEDTLRARRRGGTPVPDLVALMASPTALLVVGSVASTGMPLNAESMMPIPASWFAATDPVQGFRLQLVRRPADEFAFEVLFRYRSGESGPKAFLDGLDGMRTAIAGQPFEKLVGKLLDDLARTTDGKDLTLSLALGDDEAAGARLSELLTALVPALFVSTVEVAPQPVVQQAPVQVVPAAEPEKRKDDGC